MVKRSVFFIIGLAVGIGLMELTGFKPTVPKLHIDSTQYKVSAVQVPEQISFAGEPVPLHDKDVYQRLDRELLVNTYWHSHTLLHIKRAHRWFPVIEKILREEGVPSDFKYMAVAESSLDFNAVSPDGARGMWQLMEGTAKDLGLTVNDHIDERYHIEKATRAACRYLKEAHQQFGSWTLAAASYNVGKDAIKRILETQKADSYYDLYLNTETGRFVFRILAIKSILSNPSAFGFNIPKENLYEPYDYNTVIVDSTIEDLAKWAGSQETNYKQLKLLNPWLSEPHLLNESGDTFKIKIPVSHN